MKKEKPVVVNELSLNEYILVFKYFMKKAKCAHVTGFVNMPLLYAKPDQTEMEQLVNLALKHGILVRNGNKTTINEVVYTFINAWTHSSNVVTIKKVSYSDQKGIFVTKLDGMYLAILQDAVKDRAVLVADSDIGIIYDYFRGEIEKKDTNKQFKLKNANKIFSEKSRSIQLEVDPVNQIFLQCFNNIGAKKYEADELIHIGKKQLEEIFLNDNHSVIHIERCSSDELKEVIVRYIDSHCYANKEHGNEPEATDEKIEDPEYYTRLSFMKLTRNETFPKGLLGFIKMMFVNFFKSFTDWKNILKRVGLCVLMSVLTLVWNLYALCYLNDTFNINIRAVFGKATAYLLAGVADTSSVIGLPTFVRTVNTVTITALLYYLLAIVLRAIVGDIVSGKIKTNLSHIFSFGKNIKNYTTAVPREMSYYIWTGLAIASVLNMVVFNPFTVFLLSIMILFSCMKCEDGAIAPFLMIFHTSTRYKKVMSGKSRAPLFGEYQLRLFGISIGLILCSILNAILWFVLDFNFWVRLTISIVIIILAFIKLGIIKVSKPTVAVIFLLSIISVQIVIFMTASPSIVFADDGGWTESGGTLAGLMQNYGWQTVLGFSLTLAAAVAVGCLTFGLGTAVVAGAAATTFGAAALGATFTETGRKAAYDFIWGNYSPYGGDSKLASVLNMGVSLVPGFGDAFSVVTGVRDCSYDIKEGDWGALALDGFGLALDTHGLIGEVGDVLKNTDDVADIAKNVGKNADGIVSSAGKYADEVVSATTKKSKGFIDENQLQATKEAISNVKKVDPIKANEEATEALRQVGKDVGYSEEVIEKYISRLESDKQYEITKEAKNAWGDGWDKLTSEEKQMIKDIISDEDVTALKLTEKKVNGIDTITEYKRRYDEGLFDTEKYSLDDILELKLSKAAGTKVYTGIEHSELLPRADEFISDDAIVQYVKNLCPDNENLLKCTNLQEVADELSRNPVELELVAFQNAEVNGANILSFEGNFGDVNTSLESGGGIFSVPISKLSEYSDKYSDICSYEGGVFRISDYERFGQEVLSGVPLNSVDGAYMITTKVPLNGLNISMPSVNSWSAYMDQFVSGGKLLSGEVEVTQKPLHDIISNAISSGTDELSGISDGVGYTISIMR